MNYIEIENLSFSYDSYKTVLQNINMQFEQGKLYGVFGKSGAGKSTLLSLIAGLEKISVGDIKCQGKSIQTMNRDQYRSQHIGVIFQSYNLLPHLTALENVILSMDISGKKIDHKMEKALVFLKEVGLNEEKANRKILHLSGGEQQRVSIARAISYDCDIILADEPTGNLDKETEEDILKILTNLAHKKNKCVIIISHSSKVKQKVDFIYHLKNGKLADDL